MEPGRVLVGDAGLLITSVIGTANRGEEHWLYLDAGVFNALMETIEGFQYQLHTEAIRPASPLCLGRPNL